MSAPRDGVAKAVVSGAFAALIWGTFPVVTKLGMTDALTAFDITALRFAVAGAVLLPLFARRRLGSVPWRAVRFSGRWSRASRCC
jgi:drug/metabolite transporter (DMT)-like permease